MTFKVIDSKTGKEPTSRVIDNIARKGGLMTMDIDQFFVGEDGSLVLADDCGNITYCDSERFKVVADIEHTCHTCKHYLTGEYDGSCGSYICKDYSGWQEKKRIANHVRGQAESEGV